MASSSVVLDYQILRDVSISSRYKSFKAKNTKGELFTLTRVNTEELLHEYKRRLHEDDPEMEEGDVDRLARERLGHDRDELKRIFEIAKTLSHPAIPSAIDWISDSASGESFFVAEYVPPGENIFQSTDGHTPLQMISIFIPLLEAVGYIHREGYLHGNLKAGIVRTDLESHPPLTKLISYGHLAPIEGSDKEMLRGTGIYAAPELIKRDWPNVGTWTDLYSIGAVMYYCITRKLPFDSRKSFSGKPKLLAQHVERYEKPPAPLKNCVSDPRLVPDALEFLVTNLLEPDPAKREFKTAPDVINYLYEKWPKESKEMPIEGTITIG